MRGGWNPPPWFAKPAARLRFVRDLKDLQGLRLGRTKEYPGAFCVQFELEPDGVPKRDVVIIFSLRSPNVPRVTVSGPEDSPHRYNDGTLCMWYPHDHRQRRWIPADGAEDLVVRIALHLVKEEWFRQTGDWIGEEVRHGRIDPRNDPLEGSAA